MADNTILDDSYYVVHVKVQKVMKNKPTTSYPRNNPPSAVRVITTMMDMGIQARTLEKLSAKVQQHMSILDEDDELEGLK